MLIPEYPILAVIHLAIDLPQVLRQVTIRPDKLKGDLLRLGETQGDEATGWIRLGDIELIAKLGRAIELHDKTWQCQPE